ncbi:GLPGLI family protein [Polaribacter sp. SA4-12]|uniref:GLPGLI family protein n=1 Tax=Polaribacter sp. SA4-12 TaxID=1312072 RepID=UPI000B3C68DC|nr:GLPGLI family protein [Polaribacter sp. SA4-12]ARV15804.1 GLPGLI family protein [Polaribacter sp. SA4-12]
MKKIIILIFSIFTYASIFSQQNFSGIVHYESTISSKKLDEYLSTKRKNIKNKTLIKSLDQVYLYTKAIKSKLTFSNREGLFIVEDKLSSDIHDLGQRINKTSAGGSNEYYYNDTNKTYLIKEFSIGEHFIYTNNYLKWELTQETRTMNGYVTNKATRNKGKVIAWYTPSIPVSFGPKGEYGLPGLILELEIYKKIYFVKKIVLNPKEKIEIKKPIKGIKVTEKEYQEVASSTIQKFKKNQGY